MATASIQRRFSAVTLDLWQTLIFDRPEWGRARSQARVQGAMEALAQAGESFSTEQVEAAYRACQRAHQEMQAGGDDLAFDAQVRMFLKHLDPSLVSRLDGRVEADVARRYGHAIFVRPPELVPEAREVLSALRGRGYRLALVSNTGATPGVLFRQILTENRALGYFDVLTFSDEVGRCKPHPEMFQRTLAALQVEPQEAVHVGDSLRADVTGAKGVGMGAIWLRGPDASEPDVQPDVTISRLADLLAVL
ncbi:MAG: HAD family hydrolase [Chloroflexi bacterium]|nr:HAD family hydrolase [Chloroflexota bacterium]